MARRKSCNNRQPDGVREEGRARKKSNDKVVLSTVLISSVHYNVLHEVVL